MSTRSDPWAPALGARTLFEAHQALSALEPALSASLSHRLDFHRRSIAIYERIADVDRGHHHEALYWVGREQRRLTELLGQNAAT